MVFAIDAAQKLEAYGENAEVCLMGEMAISGRNGLPAATPIQQDLRKLPIRSFEAPAGARLPRIAAGGRASRASKSAVHGTGSKFAQGRNHPATIFVGSADTAIHVVVPAPGGIPPSPRQKPVGALIFGDHAQTIKKCGAGNGASGLSHTRHPWRTI